MMENNDRNIQLVVLDIGVAVRVSTRAEGTIEFQPRPGAIEVLCRLKRAGVKLALDADFSRPLLDDILRCLGWDDGLVLDATVAADEVPRPRPDPGLIRRAMRLAGVEEPRSVAKVGCAPADLLAAKAAGCGLVAQVNSETEPRHWLAGEPGVGLMDLPELVLNPPREKPAAQTHPEDGANIYDLALSGLRRLTWPVTALTAQNGSRPG